MSAPELSVWFLVELTGRDKTAPGTTKTFRFVNRMHPSATQLDAYRVGLTNIRGLGYQMGLYLPSPIRGSISIDDRMDSYGYGTKFSDFWERYTFVDQAITVKQAFTEPDVGAPTYATIWSGKIASYRRFGQRDQSVTLEVLSLGIADRPVTKAIDPAVFLSAPSASYGRHIPLCLGSNVQVQGIPISNSQTSVTYALAITLGSQFPIGSVHSISWMKDFQGHWAWCKFTSTPNTAVYERVASTNSSAFPLSSIETAQLIPHGGGLSQNYCITHVTGYWRGKVANTTSDGDFIIEIFSMRYDGTSLRPDKVIAKGTAKKADYAASINVASDFAVTVALDRPVPVSYLYYGPDGLQLQQCAIMGTQTNNTTSDCAISLLSTTSNDQWSRAPGEEFGSVATGTAWRYALFGLSRSDTLSGAGVVDTDGLGFATTGIGMRTAVTNQVSPDISKLEWIFQVQGLTDDGSGTITGSAGAVIEGPYYAIKALLQEWNGSAWVAGPLGSLHTDSLDHVKQVTANRFDRLSQGRSEGRTSRLKMLEQICRETGCRIGQFLTSSASNLFVYAWGTRRTSAATITDEDANIISHQVADSASVLNRVEMLYARRLTTIGTTGAQQEGSLDSNGLVLTWTKETGALQAQYATDSEALYGKKALERAQFALLSSLVNAEHVAEMLLAENAFPEEKVELEVPYLAFRDRNLCDVVTLIHPELPCHGGSEFDVPDPYYDGGSAATSGGTDLLEGHYLKKASAYRAMVEARVLNWNINEFPTLRLLTRILNQPRDPT